MSQWQKSDGFTSSFFFSPTIVSRKDMWNVLVSAAVYLFYMLEEYGLGISLSVSSFSCASVDSLSLFLDSWQVLQRIVYILLNWSSIQLCLLNLTIVQQLNWLVALAKCFSALASLLGTWTKKSSEIIAANNHATFSNYQRSRALWVSNRSWIAAILQHHQKWFEGNFPWLGLNYRIRYL